MSTTAASTEPLAPDRRAFETHLVSARFLAGVERGDWRLVSYDWPLALCEVAAAARDGAPTVFTLRCDVTGYPTMPPTACPWDVERNQVLDAAHRPKGFRVGMVFRTDWENGTALYAPFDRLALQGHPGWANEHPRHTWDNTRDFAWFLERVFDLLNNDDYVGT